MRSTASPLVMKVIDYDRLVYFYFYFILCSFPSSESYIFIFSTGLILSIISIIVGIVAMDKINKSASAFRTEFMVT
jgi:hypothetical protein